MFNNANEFSLHIEALKSEKGTSYVETILDYCEENMIDVEEITDLISKNLKEKISMEVKRTTRAVLDHEFDWV